MSSADVDGSSCSRPRGSIKLDCCEFGDRGDGEKIKAENVSGETKVSVEGK